MYDILDNWISPLLTQSLGLYFISLIILILSGFYLLIKGGDWLSEHSSNLAFRLGVPPVIVGLTIVSIATSTPELFTSLSALRSNSPGLILGNIIGSNIANIGLILGIALLIGNVDTKDAVSFPQRICLLVVTIGFCAVLLFSPKQEIGFTSGILFLGFITSYLFLLTFFAITSKKASSSLDQPHDNSQSTHGISYSIIMLVVSTFALWAGADSLVYGSKNLAQFAGVPEELIGFTLLAVGTSLPELAASIYLVKKNQSTMLLGNIVGSNLFNISLIGGLAGVMGPVRSGSENPWIDHVFLIFTTLMLTYWLQGRTLTKKDGVILLLVYTGASLCTWSLNA